MKAQTALVASHAMMWSLVKLRQLRLLHMRCSQHNSHSVIKGCTLAIKLSGIVPLACSHFGWCFYNEIRSRAFFSAAHLQSKDATPLCFHCLHLLLHTDTVTHRRVYTQTLLHTEAFTHRRCYTQKLLHTEAFTHRRFFTQTLLHTDAFTHRLFYTQTRLHTDAVTHRSFYTQKLLHTDAFSHRLFYTQTLLHTDSFTHRSFDDRTSFRAKGLRGQVGNRNFSSVFDDRTSFRAKGLRGTS